MKILTYALLSFVAIPGAAIGQTALQPGEYLDGRGGYLTIKPGSGGNLPFTIHTVGMNMHTCDVDGQIGKNGQAIVKPDGENTTCTVYFTQKADGIDVSLKKECGGFCGARASFDGMFLKPAAGCDRAGVRKARTAFKRLYDKKAYAEARTTLEPVLSRCTKTLDSDEEGWVRNDLAITLLRLGDPATCRKTLEPLAEDAAKTDAKIKEELPPSDAERVVRIARATRTNLKLCQGQPAKP